MRPVTGCPTQRTPEASMANSSTLAVVGSAAECEARLRRLVELGLDRVVVVPDHEIPTRSR